MKELIDVKFKILGYIKFLEYMNMGEEIMFEYEYEDNFIFTIYHIKLIDGRLKIEDSYDCINPLLSDFIYRFNKDPLGPLIKLGEYLEETYEFLPKGKDLNEYLYKLAVINGFN